MSERANYYPNEKDLQVRVNNLERLKGQLDTDGQNLGTNLGPTNLNFRNPDLLPTDPTEKALEGSSRAIKVIGYRRWFAGEVKEMAAQIAADNIEIQRKQNSIQIEASANRLREMQGQLSPEEIQALEEMFKQVLPDISLSSQSEAPKAPAKPVTPTPPIETKSIEPAKPEEEENDLPEIFFDEKELTLRFNNETPVALVKNEAILVKTLYENRDQNFTITQLWEKLQDAGSKSKIKAIVSVTLRQLERKLKHKIFKLVKVEHSSNTKWSLPRKTEKSAKTPKTPEIPEGKEVIIAPVTHKFDAENQTLQIGEKVKRLTPQEFIFVKTLHDQVGSWIDSTKLQEILTENEIRSTTGRIAYGLEHYFLVEKLFDRRRKEGKFGKWSLGMSPTLPDSETDQNLLVAPVAYKFDPERKALKIGDREIILKGSLLVVFNCLYENLGNFVERKLIDTALKGLGQNTGAAQLLHDLERKFDTNFVIRTYKISDKTALYALGVSPDQSQKPSEPNSDSKDSGKGRESHLKFKRTLPNGQEIEIQGRIRLEALDLLLKATKDKPVSTANISKDTAYFLRKILTPLGWNIIQSNTTTRLVEGNKGFYYLEEIKKDETQNQDSAATSIDINQQKADIEELEARILSIEAQMTTNSLSEQSSPMLASFRRALEEKRAELAKQESLLETLPTPPVSETAQNLPVDQGVVEVRYQRSPETIRSADETNLLNYITDQLPQLSRFWFDRIQESLHAEQNPARLVLVRGTNSRRFKPYETDELKALLASGYKKMAEDSQIPKRREDWNKTEELTWNKLQQLVQRIGEGDTRKFLQKVYGMFETASNKYYDLYEDRRPGEGWLI
ncbi:MAG: hypothetical protein Q7R49_03780 [Candidatus Daviesbacteria bacterium]|nr:hypothetical protein [Candidatus Daviesbacteria bacterium]